MRTKRRYDGKRVTLLAAYPRRFSEETVERLRKQYREAQTMRGASCSLVTSYMLSHEWDKAEEWMLLAKAADTVYKATCMLLGTEVAEYPRSWHARLRYPRCGPSDYAEVKAWEAEAEEGSTTREVRRWVRFYVRHDSERGQAARTYYEAAKQLQKAIKEAANVQAQ